jgi:hypothetical protein
LRPADKGLIRGQQGRCFHSGPETTGTWRQGKPNPEVQKIRKVATESKTQLHIILDLEEIGPTQTRIHFKINADASGQMKRIYEAIINGQRAKIESQFVANVGKALGAPMKIEGLPQEA